jgi:syntaxin 5
VAKNKSSFEDKPVEIQELTFIVKQDIARLNSQIAALQTYQKNNRTDSANQRNNKQFEEHSTNVVVSLQSKLATTSNSFKDILETRTQVNHVFCAYVEYAIAERKKAAIFRSSFIQ